MQSQSAQSNEVRKRIASNLNNFALEGRGKSNYCAISDVSSSIISAIFSFPTASNDSHLEYPFVRFLYLFLLFIVSGLF